jgi:hydrocephalus-inducing protein
MKYSCKIVLYTDNVPLVDPGYFYISPKSGELAPNCDEVFTVRFSPTEVDVNNERFLVFSIENLEKGSEPLVIELNGETERPICHFELQPSSYREKKPDLDPSFNVIEFESLGTKVKNTKRFYVVNPTSQGYEYEWKRIEEGKLPTSANVTN